MSVDKAVIISTTVPASRDMDILDLYFDVDISLIVVKGELFYRVDITGSNTNIFSFSNKNDTPTWTRKYICKTVDELMTLLERKLTDLFIRIRDSRYSNQMEYFKSVYLASLPQIGQVLRNKDQSFGLQYDKPVTYTPASTASFRFGVDRKPTNHPLEVVTASDFLPPEDLTLTDEPDWDEDYDDNEDEYDDTAE